MKNEVDSRTDRYDSLTRANRGTQVGDARATLEEDGGLYNSPTLPRMELEVPIVDSYAHDPLCGVDNVVLHVRSQLVVFFLLASVFFLLHLYG
jgi:hypothetical protein